MHRPAYRWLVRAALAATTVAAVAPRAAAQPTVPTPSAQVGLTVGADRVLADWRQITGYFSALAGASPAVRLDTLGPTTNGLPMIVATISTPANIRNLDAIRARQARLADPRGLSAAEEAQLVATQPTVVMISCNIHATEIASSQMAMELAHRLATNDSLQRSLENVIVLLVPSMNPDGQQMVTEWYRKGVGTPFEGGPLPYLYHHYVGHDNNRDWYMVTQKETRLITDLLYRRWFPEIFYDVHQQGNEGMRLTLPPHVDPVNPNVDPLIVRGINQIGMEMSFALESRGKTGVGDGVTYDLWWHGGARSTPTRHNMIGLLSEAASVKIATPITQRLSDLKGHPRGLPTYERRVNFPNPWPGGTWRLRDIMDYELIAAEALVHLASEKRADYVRNFVQLGRKAVRLGQSEAPYAFVIPAVQHDPAAVARLVEVLRVGGVEVGRARSPFTAGGRAFAAGAYVVSMAQPYRAHAKDLLEPQRFPKMEQYPGGPPEQPYDVAGWTLPYQMGVDVHQIDTPLSVATAPVVGMRDEPIGCTRGPGRGRFYEVLDVRDTRSFATLGMLLRGGDARVRVAAAPVTLTSGGTAPAGSFVLTNTVRSTVGGCIPNQRFTRTLPAGRTISAMPRVALYKPWTGNMDEGWTRWVLEQFAIPFTSISDSVVKAGALRDRFDVVLVPDMSLREAQDGSPGSTMPAEYAGGLGQAGLAQLATFARAGGTLVMLDHAAEIATEALDVPVRLITVPSRRGAAPASDGARQADALYAPGSILRVLVDTNHPVAAGMPDTAAVYFTNSVTFDVAGAPGARVIARYPARADDVLLSGYLQGGTAIAGKAAAVEVPVGNGRVVLFGFRPQYRGQSYGTFRLLFNALLDGGREGAR